MSMPIVSISGVRGVVWQSLTPEIISSYVSAFAQYCKHHGMSNTIVVGADGRQHGDIVSQIAIHTLRACGMDVVDIGIVPTPTVQIMIEHLQAGWGISVSASHNPQERNGLKFLNADGTFPIQSQVDEIISYVWSSDMYVDIDSIWTLTHQTDALDIHLDKVLAIPYIDLQIVRSRKLRVVIDAVNASGSKVVVKLCQELGCEVIPLFVNESGIFPHTPEPIPANLTLLCQAVLDHQADLGIAVDPDADRLVLIADDGKPFVEENTIVTCIAQVFKKSDSFFSKQAKIATVNLSTTRSAEDVATKYGGICYRSAIWEINVVTLMKSNQSLVGWEGSGGIILPDVHYGRDSLVGIALTLQEFAEYTGTVSQYRDALPQYHIVKLKLEWVSDPDALISKLKTHFAWVEWVVWLNDIDGLKIDFIDHRVHFRKSNTEPIVRIYAEWWANIAELAEGYETLARGMI